MKTTSAVASVGWLMTRSCACGRRSRSGAPRPVPRRAGTSRRTGTRRAQGCPSRTAADRAAQGTAGSGVPAIWHVVPCRLPRRWTSERFPGVGAVETIGLFAAGACAGAVNAVAGGGSLVTFPALLAFGYSPLAANVTNQVGLVPGYLGGSIGYRSELAGQRGRARALGVTASLGAAAGT